MATSSFPMLNVSQSSIVTAHPGHCQRERGGPHFTFLSGKTEEFLVEIEYDHTLRFMKLRLSLHALLVELPGEGRNVPLAPWKRQ